MHGTLKVILMFTFASHIGLLATGIEKMDGIGGLAGWRWIFILEGLITVAFALVAAVFLPADIGSAKFFTEEEREFACQYYLIEPLPIF